MMSTYMLEEGERASRKEVAAHEEEMRFEGVRSCGGKGKGWMRWIALHLLLL